MNFQEPPLALNDNLLLLGFGEITLVSPTPNPHQVSTPESKPNPERLIVPIEQAPSSV